MPRLIVPGPDKALTVAPEVVAEISKFELSIREEDAAIDPLPERAKVPEVTVVVPVCRLVPVKVKVFPELIPVTMIFPAVLLVDPVKVELTEGSLTVKV